MDILSVIAGPLYVLILMTRETGPIQSDVAHGLPAVFAKHGGIGVGVDAKEMRHNISLIGTQGLRRLGGYRRIVSL